MVLANIHKNVLSQDMQVFARVLVEGGRLLLSGFFEGDVRHAIVRGGRWIARGRGEILEGWACMAC